MTTNLAAHRLGRFYTHSCNHSIITTLFQTYFHILSQSILKIINFILFSALKLTKRNPYESYSVNLSGEKRRKLSVLYLI